MGLGLHVGSVHSDSLVKSPLIFFFIKLYGDSNAQQPEVGPLCFASLKEGSREEPWRQGTRREQYFSCTSRRC